MRTLVFIIFLFIHYVCYSTTIQFMSLQEKCFRSDLVALVEVTQAGGIYAEYQIIESYKGKKSGKIIVYDPPGPHGPYFPTVLYGDKYLIFASKNKELTQFTSSSSVMGNPMALRKIKFDYRLPFAQGKINIADVSAEQDLLNQVKDFLSYTKEEQKMFFTREYFLGIYGRLGKYSNNLRKFILQTEEDKIIEAYKKLTSDDFWRLGIRKSLDKEFILSRHKELNRNFAPHNFDKLNFLSPRELHQQWNTFIERAQRDPKHELVVFRLKQALFITEFEYGDYVNFENMSDEELKSYQKNILYLNSYDQSEFLTELTSRQIPVEPKLLNKLFHRKIESLGVTDEYNSTFTIVNLGMPTEKEILLKKLKNKPFKYHHESKECLLAFLGDKDAQQRIKGKILKQAKIGNLGDLSEELNALKFFDREFFMTLEQFPVSRKEVIELLLEEDPIVNENRVLKILKGQPKESIGYYFTNYRVKKSAPEIYNKYISYLSSEDQLEEKLDSNPSDYTELKELIFSYSGHDKRTIFNAFTFLLENNDSDTIKFYKSHKTTLNNEYFPFFAQLYCSQQKEDIPKLETLYQSNDPFSHYSLRYLFINDKDKYIGKMLSLLESDNLKTKLKIAIILAEHGYSQGIDTLFTENLDPFQETEDHILRTDLYVLQGRIKSLFSNMSEGKTNNFSYQELKRYWEKNRISFKDPWRKILDPNFCE